jgi:hypothetical protein
MKTDITYFEKPGKENTKAVMEIVKQKAEEKDIKTIVVASYHGFTAEQAVRYLKDMNIIVIAGFLEATPENLSLTFSQGDEKQIREKATVLVTTHLFAGVSRAVRRKFESTSPNEIIAQTLRLMGVGVKVGVECTVMAADSGLVSIDEDVIAIAGTYSGADTAIVLRPVYSQNLFDIKIKEILCKPNEW